MCFSCLDTGLRIVYFFNYIEIDPRHKGQTVTQYSEKIVKKEKGKIMTNTERIIDIGDRVSRIEGILETQEKSRKIWTPIIVAAILGALGWIIKMLFDLTALTAKVSAMP